MTTIAVTTNELNIDEEDDLGPEDGKEEDDDELEDDYYDDLQMFIGTLAFVMEDLQCAGIFYSVYTSLRSFP